MKTADVKKKSVYDRNSMFLQSNTYSNKGISFVDNRESSIIQKKQLEGFFGNTKNGVIQLAAITDINNAKKLFGVNEDLKDNFKNYKTKVSKMKNSKAKSDKAKGLLHWSEHYHKEAAGSDAEIRRVLYHQTARGNDMRLGKSNKGEADLVGSVAGRSRAEEVKAVTTADRHTVDSQINRALLQLEEPRSIGIDNRKVVIYIYNDRNPWPFDSIKDAAKNGTTTEQIRVRALEKLRNKHQRTLGGIHILIKDINKFTSTRKNNGNTFIEMTWPNAAKKTPASRAKGTAAVADMHSPLRN
ncbi:MAG: hypothetical protein EVB11_03115 [Winogradskyella sp.]|nr:MAG: hypothetical protein EVB11_03115 [Winogradskyella sp.]